MFTKLPAVGTAFCCLLMNVDVAALQLQVLQQRCGSHAIKRQEDGAGSAASPFGDCFTKLVVFRKARSDGALITTMHGCPCAVHV